MKTLSMLDRLNQLSTLFCIRFIRKLEDHIGFFILLAVFLICSQLPESAFALNFSWPPVPAGTGNSAKYKEVCANVLNALEGPLGALLTVCAGVGAIVSSAMGGFKMAWTLIVVSVGCYILPEYIDWFFEPCQ